jgi:hypothetical protein
MSLIGFNGDYTIAQPSGLKEEIKQKVVDRESIKGGVHRYWEAQKKQASLHFAALNQTQYAQIVAYVYGGGAAITYSNVASGFTFTGFATVAEAEYIPGASMLKDMDITIVEK